MYSIVLAKVRIGKDESEWFEILTGFRQGCILSPTLFNLVLDYILRQLEKRYGPRLHLQCVNDMEYADDTCLIAECLEKILEVTELLAKESEKFGLKINTKKTKIMPVKCDLGPENDAIVMGNDIETVHSFIYLGSELTSDGDDEKEIKRRMALAGSIFDRLNKKIFRRHEISLALKMRLFNVCVIPVITYAASTWTMSKKLENKLDACETRWLRRMLRIKPTDRISNEIVRGRTKQITLSSRIRKMRLKWLGHVLRMNEKRITKKVFEWNPKGSRRRGRPKKRWIDCVDEDLKRCGLSIYGKTMGRTRVSLEGIAEDRGRWREVVMASMAGHSWKMTT